MLVKLSKVQADYSELPVVWPNHYRREHTSGPDRLVIAPRDGLLNILREMAEHLGPSMSLLYVLIVPRGSQVEGRYESPMLDLHGVRTFLDEFGDCLTHDARHELWIGQLQERHMLIYDQHGLLYAYGPLEDFERILRQWGLTPGDIEIPIPHAHHYHSFYDKSVDRILASLSWQRTELQPADSE